MDPTKFGMVNAGAPNTAEMTPQGEEGNQLDEAAKAGTVPAGQQQPATGAAGASSSFTQTKYVPHVMPPYAVPQYYLPYMLPGNYQYPYMNNKNAAAGYYYQNAYLPTAAPISGSTATAAGISAPYAEDDFHKFAAMNTTGAMPPSSYYGQPAQGGVAGAGVQQQPDASGKMMSPGGASKSYGQQGGAGANKPPGRQPRTQASTNAPPQGYDTRMYPQQRTDQYGYAANRQYGQYNNTNSSNPAYFSGQMQ